MAKIRMYVQRGCPACEAAKQFFAKKKISVESIEIGFDPFLMAGIRAAAPGGVLPVPIIVSFATQEWTAGNDPAQLERIAAGIVRGAGASDPAA